MDIKAITGIQSYYSSAYVYGARLNPETIRKLKELGIDPNKVQSESQAQELIRQKETEKNNTVQPYQQAAQASQQVAPQSAQQPAHNNSSLGGVDLNKLNDRIKAFAKELNVQISLFDSLNKIVKKLDAAVTDKIDKSKNPNGAQGVGVVPNNQKDDKQIDAMKAELNYIKSQADMIESARTAMYAGQDMMASLNRYSLGL